MTTPLKHLNIFSDLPPNFQSVTEQLVKFISPHVQPSNGAKSFNWPSFKNAMDNYDGVDIVIAGFNSPSTSKTPFKKLPTQCAGELIGPLSMPIAEADLALFLKKTFNDLKSAKENGWADFKQLSPGEPGKRPPVPAVYGWEYRTLLLAESSSRTSDFPALIGVMTIGSSKLAKEIDWYQLDESSDEEITLDLTSMKLAVDPGFQAT
ncbi:hypothetical protein RSAG8_06695, partial [Rhizoctonia solani AG-8 WAC10335]